MNDEFGIWYLDHPWRALLLFMTLAIAGALSGAGLAWLSSAVGWVSPDNILAGSAFGVGGALTGMVAGGLLVNRQNKR